MRAGREGEGRDRKGGKEGMGETEKDTKSRVLEAAVKRYQGISTTN